MAALWKYEIVVMDAAEGQPRTDTLWELGRSGWELVQVLPGNWRNGQTADATKMTWFLKREATHDINF